LDQWEAGETAVAAVPESTQFEIAVVAALGLAVVTTGIHPTAAVKMQQS
jgi:hypothetical protein